MKHFTVLLLTLLLSLHVMSQEYKPFNFESGEWFCVYSTKGGMFGGNHGTHYATDSVKFYCNGDTVINDEKFKKLLYSGYTSSQIVERTSISGYYGAIRNDTLQKRVYFNSAKYNSCYVLYDFDLSIGDSIQVSCELDDKDAVSQIDSVLYCNQYHKRYNTPSGYFIIEGIGSKDGFISAPCPPNNGRIFCYKENGNDLCNDCGSLTSINLYTNASLNIFPNPTKGKVQISSDLKIQYIELFDINGRLVELINDDFKFIELKVKGLYLLRIHTDSGVFTRKIIKE